MYDITITGRSVTMMVLVQHCLVPGPTQQYQLGLAPLFLKLPWNGQTKHPPYSGLFTFSAATPWEGY